MDATKKALRKTISDPTLPTLINSNSIEGYVTSLSSSSSSIPHSNSYDFSSVINPASDPLDPQLSPTTGRSVLSPRTRTTQLTPIETKAKGVNNVPSSMLVLNPVIEGELNFKSKGKWKHKFVVLDPNSLYIFKSAQDRGTPIQVSLNLASAKPIPKKTTHFRLLTNTASFKFEANNEPEAKQWMITIQCVCDSLTLKSIGHNKLSLDNKDELFSLLKEPGNDICADCGAKDPEWASVNLGVFLCIECSGIHRNIGVHITKVRSIKLDTWDAEQVRVMKLIGNTKANSVWEANVPSSFQKPKPNASALVKQEWIQEKYELGLFKQMNKQIESPRPEHKDVASSPGTTISEDSWKEAFAPDGRKYYYNRLTKKTTWNMPKSMRSFIDWREATAPDGRMYYYNIKTKERTWNKPLNVDILPANQSDQQIQQAQQ